MRTEAGVERPRPSLHHIELVASLPPVAFLLLAEPPQAGSVHRLQVGVCEGPVREDLPQLVQEDLLQALTSLGHF